MALTDPTETRIRKLMFGGTPTVFPSMYYFGLSSTQIAEDASGATEPSGGGYARVAIPNNTTNFVDSGGATTNGTVIQFPVPTAPWGGAAYWFLADLPSGGTILMRGTISPTQTFNTGERPYFDIGALTISVD